MHLPIFQVFQMIVWGGAVPGLCMASQFLGPFGMQLTNMESLLPVITPEHMLAVNNSVT